jgi:hypothetical protein
MLWRHGECEPVPCVLPCYHYASRRTRVRAAVALGTKEECLTRTSSTASRISGSHSRCSPPHAEPRRHGGGRAHARVDTTKSSSSSLRWAWTRATRARYAARAWQDEQRQWQHQRSRVAGLPRRGGKCTERAAHLFRGCVTRARRYRDSLVCRHATACGFRKRSAAPRRRRAVLQGKWWGWCGLCTPWQPG